MRPVRRLVVPLAVLAAALALGAARQPVAPDPDATREEPASGRELWLRDCAVCHGPAGSGSERGPDITREGTAAVDFMLRTGRMPIADPDEPLRRSDPHFDEDEIRAIVDHTATFVTGPEAFTPTLEGTSLARGSNLYLDRCAGCHQSAGAGGPLANGNVAPALHQASAREVGEAVRTGPGDMPTYDPEVLSDDELDDLAAYVVYLRSPEDPGGWGLGHVGPVPEGLVAFGALAGMVVATRWLGTRRGQSE